MKRVVLLLVLALLYVSCHKDDINSGNEDGSSDLFTMTFVQLDLSSAEDTIIEFTANSSWILTVDTMWFEVSKMSGNIGDQKVKISGLQQQVEDCSAEISIIGENMAIIVSLKLYGIGDGTKKNPYLIWNVEQLKALSDSVENVATTEKCYKQMADIDLGGEEWNPIGYANMSSGMEYPFCGNYDGNGYSVKNLCINNSHNKFCGLFGRIENALISNLTVDGNICSSNNYVGGICGFAINSTIDGCTNKVEIKSDSKYVGGICGFAKSYLVTLEEPTYNMVRSVDNSIHLFVLNECKNLANISGSFYVGGICGYNTGISLTTRCANAGSIAGVGDMIGGICGGCDSGSWVTDCENQGGVTGCNDIGGICGFGYGVIDCENQGEIYGNGKDGSHCIGGICGHNEEQVLINCINKGNIGRNGLISNIMGGICGNRSGIIVNCGNLGSVYGGSYVGGIYGGNDASSALVCNVFNTGKIIGINYVGGITGNSYKGAVTNSYNSGEIVSSGEYVGSIAGTGYITYFYWLDGSLKAINGLMENNYSAFNNNMELKAKVVYEDSSYLTLVEALNFYVDSHRNQMEDLKRWVIKDDQNNGFPIFE